MLNTLQMPKYVANFNMAYALRVAANEFTHLFAPICTNLVIALIGHDVHFNTQKILSYSSTGIQKLNSLTLAPNKYHVSI
jgi:hypothetical protein